MADQIRTDPDWEDIRMFVALARHGSLSATARAIGTSHATVSRRMQSLETTVGRKLLDRRPTGYSLTPAGSRLLASATEMEAAAATMMRGSEVEGISGLVRINAPPSLAQTYLVERLSDLTGEHPGIDLEIASDVRAVSLERREADLVLRLSQPLDGDVIAVAVAPFECGFYGTVAWREHIDDGRAPTFVGFTENNASLPDALWLAQAFHGKRVAMRSSSHTTQAIAASHGAGLALLPHFVGRAFPNLVHCDLGKNPPERKIWLMVRRSDMQNRAVRFIREQIMQTFAKDISLFEALN